VEAGGWLASEWKLPESIAQVIVHHHSPGMGALSETSVVHMACCLADLLGFSADPSTEITNFDAIVAPQPEGVRSHMRAKLPVLRAAILAEAGLPAQTEASTVSAEKAPGDRALVSPIVRSETRSRGWVVGELGGAAVLLLAILAFVFR
jgi:hypothetical protein